MQGTPFTEVARALFANETEQQLAALARFRKALSKFGESHSSAATGPCRYYVLCVCVCMFALPSASFTMARGAVVHVCMYNYRPALCTSLAVLSLTDFDFPMFVLHTLLLSLSLPSPSLPLLLYLHHSSSLPCPHLFSLLSFPPPILSFFPLLFSPLSLSLSHPRNQGQSPPIQEVIDTGCVPRVVEILTFDNPSLQVRMNHNPILYGWLTKTIRASLKLLEPHLSGLLSYGHFS